MEHKDSFILSNIVEFCDLIAGTIKRFGDDFEVFDRGVDYQDTYELRIIQIGELVNDLSDAFKNAHPEIPWKSIVGTRNIITHDYGVLSNSKVWDTLKNDIPELRRFCVGIVKPA